MHCTNSGYKNCVTPAEELSGQVFAEQFPRVVDVFLILPTVSASREKIKARQQFENDIHSAILD